MSRGSVCLSVFVLCEELKKKLYFFILPVEFDLKLREGFKWSFVGAREMCRPLYNCPHIGDSISY